LRERRRVIIKAAGAFNSINRIEIYIAVCVASGCVLASVVTSGNYLIINSQRVAFVADKLFAMATDDLPALEM